jgi:hypothetical protein
MLLLMAVGILGSDRLDGLFLRLVILIAERFLPSGLSQGLASAILSATIAVVLYGVVIWLVLTAWNRSRSR